MFDPANELRKVFIKHALTPGFVRDVAKRTMPKIGPSPLSTQPVKGPSVYGANERRFHIETSGLNNALQPTLKRFNKNRERHHVQAQFMAGSQTPEAFTNAQKHLANREALSHGMAEGLEPLRTQHEQIRNELYGELRPGRNGNQYVRGASLPEFTPFGANPPPTPVSTRIPLTPRLFPKRSPLLPQKLQR